jgi:hypothetical protein
VIGELQVRYRAEFPDRKIEPLDVRRRRQSIEGAQAMKDYRRTQEVARERMAALKEKGLRMRSRKNDFPMP